MRWMAHSVWMAMRSIQHPPEAAIPAIGREGLIRGMDGSFIFARRTMPAGYGHPCIIHGRQT